MKLSDALVLDARLVGVLTERSIAGQIEFWASIGRSMERLMQTETVLRLKRNSDEHPLSECLRSVDTDEGRHRTAAYLATRPYPHFEAAPGRPGLLVKIDEDGTRTVGRFVRREFRAVRE